METGVPLMFQCDMNCIQCICLCRIKPLFLSQQRMPFSYFSSARLSRFFFRRLTHANTHLLHFESLTFPLNTSNRKARKQFFCLFERAHVTRATQEQHAKKAENCFALFQTQINDTLILQFELCKQMNLSNLEMSTNRLRLISMQTISFLSESFIP